MCGDRKLDDGKHVGRWDERRIGRRCRRRWLERRIGRRAGSGSSGDDACSSELEFGPFLIELSGDALGDGIVAPAFDVPVPAGTFDEIEIQVDPIPAEKAGGNAGLLEMAKANASIIVDGVVDPGTDAARTFSFATSVEVEQKREGQVVIGGANGANVTLDLDVRRWFTAPGGGRLDPADPTNRNQIEQNIGASIRLVKDDDHDGCDDDHESACSG